MRATSASIFSLGNVVVDDMDKSFYGRGGGRAIA